MPKSNRSFSRRDFLKLSGTSVIGLTVAACAPTTQATTAPQTTTVPQATAVPATAVPATAVPATAVPATAVPATAVPKATATIEATAAPQAVTLTFWDDGAATPGIQKTEVAMEVARKTGVTLNVIQGDSAKFKALLAGGDLPDIIPSSPATQGIDAPTLIKSGQLLAMDDLLGKFGGNITKKYAKVLEFSKKYLSNGENKVYYLPVSIYNMDPNKPDLNFYGVNLGYMPRWDLYAKLGYPESKSMDDFLNILKKMQDLSPTTADGKKVYAISGWSDWGIWPWFVPWIYENGYRDRSNSVLIDVINGKAVNLYHSDVFWSGLKYYNKAFRMGIVDPEAFTMKYSNWQDKLNRGQTLLAFAPWQVGNVNSTFETSGQSGVGFEKVLTGNPYIDGIFSANYPVGFGTDHALAINKNSKNQEACIRLMDFAFSDEGARLLRSGIKGKQWDIIDGKPQFTKEFFDKKAKSATYVSSEVGISSVSLGVIADNQILDDGYPANLGGTDDQKAKLAIKVDVDCAKHYGDFQFPGQAMADLYKKGQVKTPTEFWMFTYLVQSPTDQTSRTISQADEYMKVAIAKVIMANSDSNFDAEVAKAKKDLTGKGYDTAAAEMTKLYEDAQKAASGFSMK